MEFIITNNRGEEEGYLRHKGIDIDIGVDNDFEIEIDIGAYDESICGEGCQFFNPGTEYGGIIKNVNPVTKEKVVRLSGSTWRGKLNQTALEPDSGQDYKILNGNANVVMNSLFEECGISDLFVARAEKSEFEFNAYQCPLHVMLADGLAAALEKIGARLSLAYLQGPPNGTGYVRVEAVPIVDYSNTIEFSQDSNINVDILDYKNGVNHLICLGKGELSNRTRIDLYAWPDGTIKKQPYYTGLDMHEEFYEYTSAEDALTLEEYGRKRLAETMNYQQMKVSVENAEYLELGDIIAGRDRITGMTIKSPVVQKIVKVESNGRTTMTPKLKGES